MPRFFHFHQRHLFYVNDAAAASVSSSRRVIYFHFSKAVAAGGHRQGNKYGGGEERTIINDKAKKIRCRHKNHPKQTSVNLNSVFWMPLKSLLSDEFRPLSRLCFFFGIYTGGEKSNEMNAHFEEI